MLDDLTLKDLFQSLPKRLFLELAAREPVEFLNAGCPSVQKGPGLVARLADGRICHVEFQSRGEPEMRWRMLGYRWFVRMQCGDNEILRLLLFVGPDPYHFLNSLPSRPSAFM